LKVNWNQLKVNWNQLKVNWNQLKVNWNQFKVNSNQFKANWNQLKVNWNQFKSIIFFYFTVFCTRYLVFSTLFCIQNLLGGGLPTLICILHYIYIIIYIYIQYVVHFVPKESSSRPGHTLCPFGTLTGTWLPRDHPIWRSGWVASLQPWPTEPI
jgi:hypothetical protein